MFSLIVTSLSSSRHYCSCCEIEIQLNAVHLKIPYNVCTMYIMYVSAGKLRKSSASSSSDASSDRSSSNSGAAWSYTERHPNRQGRKNPLPFHLFPSLRLDPDCRYISVWVGEGTKTKRMQFNVRSPRPPTRGYWLQWQRTDCSCM